MMSPPPAAATLLAVWDQGQGLGLVPRALLLLRAAFPEESPEALAQLCVGERDRRLLELREALFGSRMAGVTTCPACGARLELDVAPADVRALAGPPGATPLATEAAGYQVTFRLPSSADLVAMAADATNGRGLVERCIVDVHADGGQSAGRLPDEVLAAVAAAMARADPLADVHFDVRCPSCDEGWQAPFDIVSFLWHELDAWAQRTLRDVHTLASVYGWRETDILALSPRRRDFYLQLVSDERLPD